MQSVNLTHHFLIAMPNMVDPHFARSLTYICEHNEQGALGVVVNRPIEMTLKTLFEQIEIPLRDDTHGGCPCISAVPCKWIAASCCIGRRAPGSPPCPSTRHRT